MKAGIVYMILKTANKTLRTSTAPAERSGMKKRHLAWKKAVLIAAVSIAGAAVLAPAAYGAVSEDNGEQVFQNKCMGCHSLGEGDSDSGPDLATVATRRSDDWTLNIIKDPDGLIASGDPQATELVAKFGGRKMPKLGVSDEDANSIILFLKSKKVAEGGVGGLQLPPGDASRGRALFTGKTGMANGGTPCIACHNAGNIGPSGIGPMGGGVMAKDLTDVYTRLKEKSLASALNTLQYPVMQDIFKERRLNLQEIADLTAFFKEVSGQKPPSRTATLLIFALIAAAGFLLLLLVSQLIWGKRMHGIGIRKQLVGGSK